MSCSFLGAATMQAPSRVGRPVQFCPCSQPSACSETWLGNQHSPSQVLLVARGPHTNKTHTNKTEPCCVLQGKSLFSWRKREGCLVATASSPGCDTGAGSRIGELTATVTCLCISCHRHHQRVLLFVYLLLTTKSFIK